MRLGIRYQVLRLLRRLLQTVDRHGVPRRWLVP